MHRVPGLSVHRTLQERLVQLVAAARAATGQVREGHPEGVHDLRVAMRRTRSLLATFRPLLDADEVDGLRHELRRAGQELSGLRDLEVVHERIAALLAEERVEDVLGPVAARVEEHRRGLEEAARERAVALLAEERYAALLDRLEGFAAADPWPDEVAEEDVRRLLARDWRRLRRRARRADRVPPDDRQHEVALHEVRKAAKRARYAAETLEPAFGLPAAAMAEAATAVQQSLGDHRDTLLTAPVLRRLGVEAHLAGEHGFTFGRLHAREQAAGAAALAAYADARDRVDRRRLRRWLF